MASLSLNKLNIDLVCCPLLWFGHVIALGQFYDCQSADEAILKGMGKIYCQLSQSIKKHDVCVRFFKFQFQVEVQI